MTITARQLKQRAKGVGASEVPALLGLDDFQSPADVLLSKIHPTTPLQTTDAMDMGNIFEAPIARLFTKRTGLTLAHPKATFKHDAGIMFANPDRMVGTPSRGRPIVEIKWSSMADRWGEEQDGPDGIPPNVLAQVQAQMACTDAPMAYVAGMIVGGFSPALRIYEIPRMNDAIEGIVDRVATLWGDHVVNRKPLPTEWAPPSESILRRIKREPKSLCEINPDVLSRFQATKEAMEQAKEANDEARRLLIMALNNCEAGGCNLGRVTYFTQSRSGVDLDMLRARFPEAFATCQKTTTFPVLRTKFNAPGEAQKAIES